MKIDALQKYQNQLLSAFNAEQLQYLKYDNWTGLLTETDRLYATMFHDWDVLQKDSSDLAEAVQSLEWTVAPYVADGKEADAKAQQVAKTVTDALWKRSSKLPGTYSHTFPQLLNALVHALFRGFNVHEIEWVNDGELVYPAAFHQLPPQFMRWEDRAGELDRLLFVADGETAKPKPFPANKYIVALNTSGPDHPLYNAMYYSLIAWYGAYKFGLGWFMEYCQKYGMPKLVFHYESDRDRQQLEADIAEERVLNNILLKGDRSVDIANAPASGASLPQRELLNLAESQCHKLILGQTLTSDTSEHGGSLAQARVHAGVQAEVVKKRAAFVADVLNTQLIPAIVLLNYGTIDVPMPELVFKLPQEGVTLERVQVLKTALEIKGMRIKKSEAYEFMGFAQPAEGDDVFEAASETPQQGGFGAMFGQQPPPGGKGPQKVQQKPDSGDKAQPGQQTEKGDNDEPVQAAKAPTDPAQEWLAPIKQKFLEARKAGASIADLKKMLLTMHPDTKALAKAFANNILAGFAGESEEVDAANPWGCNQYGHRKGHKGGESKKKESDDVYDFDNMEPDERLQQAIDDLGEVEEEDINWDDYDKAQEVKKIFHPDNHKVAQWRKERMINEVGNRVTDALRHLANVNKASRDFRNPNRPTEDDVARAEEAFGKAVHEWRRFHRARLEVQGWDKKAIDDYLSRWPEYMETANAEEVDAANPYGCNGAQHKCPQKGTTRESKLKTKPRLFRVDPDAPIHKQKVQLAEAIEKAAHDGVHLEAVITRPEFGELIIDCGKPGKTEAKRNREQKAENEKAAKEGRERKIISSGGNGAIHAMEWRHHVNTFDIAEAIIEGKITQDPNHVSRINLATEKYKVTLEREIKQGSKKISKTRAKLHTASKI